MCSQDVQNSPALFGGFSGTMTHRKKRTRIEQTPFFRQVSAKFRQVFKADVL
jgi:hypothetical protein